MSRRATPIKVASSPSRPVVPSVAFASASSSSIETTDVPHTPPKRQLSETLSESPIRSSEVSPSKRSKYTPLPVELILLKDKNERYFGFMVVNGFN